MQFHSDEFIAKHQKLTAAVHERGAKIFLQAAIVDSVFYIDGELYQIPISQLSAENISEVVELFNQNKNRAAKVFVSEGYFKDFAVAVKNALPDLKISFVQRLLQHARAQMHFQLEEGNLMHFTGGINRPPFEANSNFRRLKKLNPT